MCAVTHSTVGRQYAAIRALKVSGLSWSSRSLGGLGQTFSRLTQPAGQICRADQFSKRTSEVMDKQQQCPPLCLPCVSLACRAGYLTVLFVQTHVIFRIDCTAQLCLCRWSDLISPYPPPPCYCCCCAAPIAAFAAPGAGTDSVHVHALPDGGRPNACSTTRCSSTTSLTPHPHCLQLGRSR
jgi:hypothetical protein